MMTLKQQIKEAQELEAKAKATRREINRFWKEVDDNQDDILEHFNKKMSDKFNDICDRYGAYTDEEKDSLFNHIMSDRQVDYYRRYNQTEATNSVF